MENPIEEYNKIEEAKKFLASKGYQTANLWTIEDVQSRFVCEPDQALEIMEQALTNEATMEQIWFALDFHGREEGLETVEDAQETLEQLLKQHDWTFDYSDDHRAYKAGAENRKRIMSYSQLDSFVDTYNKYAPERFRITK